MRLTNGTGTTSSGVFVPMLVSLMTTGLFTPDFVRRFNALTTSDCAKILAYRHTGRTIGMLGQWWCGRR